MCSRSAAAAAAREHLKTSLVPKVATAVAVVLAATSRGDAVLLAIALGVATWSAEGAIGTTGALAGAVWRWGTPSLRAIAGAQAVLGPAGWTGSGAAIATAWCGALAVVLASRSARPLGAPRSLDPILRGLPFGLTAAALVVGSGPGGTLWLRVLGSAVATGLCVAVAAWVPVRPALHAAAALGIATIVLGIVARPSSASLVPSFDGADAWEGLVLAVAAGLVVAVGALGAVAATSERGGPPPALA